MARIWNVRLNVDALNSAIIGLENDAERLAFLSGFHGGLNGKQKSDKGDAWLSGWVIAEQCLAEAKAFSDKQRQRVEKRYHGSTTVEPRNHHGTTVDLPNEQSNNLQSTIYKRTNESVRDEMDLMTPMDETEISDTERWRMEKLKPWAKEFICNGCKIGANNWTSWKRIADEWGQSETLSAAKGIPAPGRWPDRTEAALIASRGQVNPGDAINPARLHRMEL